VIFIQFAWPHAGGRFRRPLRGRGGPPLKTQVRRPRAADKNLPCEASARLRDTAEKTQIAW